MRMKQLFRAALLCFIASPAWSSCINPPASPAMIAEFKLNPNGLIASSNVDARSVEAQTRDLSGTDATLATDLVRVAENAKLPIQTAIAAGLAQAAVACSTIDQKASQQIQQAVATFENGQFQASFAAVAGDISTAATDAAASAALGSSGSVIINNPNPSVGKTITVGGAGASGTASIGAGSTGTGFAGTGSTGIGSFGFSGSSTTGSSPSNFATGAADPVSASR
jgi:hypothetical protein